MTREQKRVIVGLAIAVSVLFIILAVMVVASDLNNHSTNVRATIDAITSRTDMTMTAIEVNSG